MAPTVEDANDAPGGADTTVLLPPRRDIDFESLPWNMNLPEAHHYLHLTTTTGAWGPAHYESKSDAGTAVTAVKRYSTCPLLLHPSTTSLNYGTTIWEGLKCFRMPGDEKAVVFRPQLNHARFARGAEAMCLPPPSYELFMRCVQTAVRANSSLVPPHGVGTKLYVRPMLLGTGQQLGLYPSDEMSMLFFVSPTGNYFKGKAAGGLKLHLETKRSRAARGGLGSVKCSGNYAITLKPLQDAKAQGFMDNLYLELDTYHSGSLGKAIIQELSAANVFLVLKTGEIVTPSLDRGTILPGVTRDSVLVLAREYADELLPIVAASVGNPGLKKVTVTERDVRAEEFSDASEAFVTGTAAEIVPVASLGTGPGDDEEFSVVLPHGATLPGGPVTAKLLEMLREVMAGKRSCDATKDWLCDPFASAEEFRGKAE